MTILTRYVVTQYLRLFFLTLTAGATLYMVIHFFDRIGNLSRYDPSTAAMAAYFVFRLPAMLSEIYPAASLLAVLLSLGLAARNREILALRACGISTWQLAVPLIAVAAAMSVLVLAWNEMVVPPTMARCRYLNDVVIKKKTFQGAFNATSLWFQDTQGFISIDFYDANQQAIYGLTLYDADPSFQLNRIIEVPVLRWRDERWRAEVGTVKNIGPDGEILDRFLEPGEFELSEDPRDLAARRRRADEFSFLQLKNQIDVLRAKGLNADEFVVDLHHKMALPFAGLVTVLVGFPLAVRGGRRAGIAHNVALGLAVGFAYFVVTAVALSAGRAGGIPPVLAAWTANSLFIVLAGALYIGADTA